MSYQRDRAQFYLTAGRIGLSQYTADRLLRYASTLQRLAVAQCNGDWPYEHGEPSSYPLDTCDRCEGRWAKASMRRSQEAEDEARCMVRAGEPGANKALHHARYRVRICPDCRTAERVRAVLAEHATLYPDDPHFEARFEGDPRGYVLRLVPRGTSDEDYHSGRARIIYVPGRER